jgi:hypothetical protein
MLKDLFKPKPKDKPVPVYSFKAEAGPVEFKFWSGNVPYFGMVNGNNLPHIRFDASQQVFKELARGVDDEKLNALCKANLELFKRMMEGDKDAALEGIYINKQILERNAFSNYSYLSLKLGSCFYVRQDEDINTFDWDSAKKNVKHWMNNEQDLYAFFLKSQLIDLLPFSEYLKANIQRFLGADRERDQTEINILLRLGMNYNKNKPSESNNLKGIEEMLIMRQWPTNYGEQP